LPAPCSDAAVAARAGRGRDPRRTPGAWAAGPLAVAAASRCVRRRPGPLRRDDRVEFGPQQLFVRAHEGEELFVLRCARETGSGQGDHDVTCPGQALIACRSSPLLLMTILRGLACSATGISKVSTPAS